ncbi:MAG: glycosyltransferase [Actinomycetota bacterium]|nr:glycosyltransferase [Actinomycetota bacterium]
MPDLSVVTPVYNSARYLPATLDSVTRLAASHEHIVIDGGSTDGTVALLQARGDLSLSWVSEPDRGQTNAVNKGFERAQGELLGWLNGDDEYVSEAVDRAVEHLLAHPELDAVFGGMDITDEAGQVRRQYRPAEFSWRRYLYLGDYLPTPTIIFRRRLLERDGLLDETYVDAADYDFFLRVFRNARVERRPEALVRFRYHPDSKTARDAFRGQDEALRIRLKWAGRPHERLAMKTIERAKRLILPRISAWPKMFS